MPPDIETLRILLILAEGFTSDDGLRLIERADEDAEDYWDAPLMGICISCQEVRREALRRQLPPDGLTMPEAYAIAAWRPVRDAEGAWAFLDDHADCASHPRLELGITWD
ncbi:hypothetical protein [Geodermatophilus sp. CPCC 205761]|uniref:hypothetical protein n=1 Tax=Geodermatophilus sp. CPCC 205761 TaxID=2936597 RepID=UPI003EEEC040